MENNVINSTLSEKNFESNLKQVHTDKYIETAQNVRLYVKDYGQGKP
ncbi:alpha/beta hydrolase, partial [Flavobacterium circumlabens]